MDFATCYRVGLQDLSSYLNKIVFSYHYHLWNKVQYSWRNDASAESLKWQLGKGRSACCLLLIPSAFVVLPLWTWHFVKRPKISTGISPMAALGAHDFSLHALFGGHWILRHSPCPEADNRWLESAKGNLGKGKCENTVLKYPVTSFNHITGFHFDLYVLEL